MSTFDELTGLDEQDSHGRITKMAAWKLRAAARLIASSKVIAEIAEAEEVAHLQEDLLRFTSKECFDGWNSVIDFIDEPASVSDSYAARTLDE